MYQQSVKYLFFEARYIYCLNCNECNKNKEAETLKRREFRNLREKILNLKSSQFKSSEDLKYQRPDI